MANLTETSTWEAGIYQLETTDQVLGGAAGIANQQAKQLANRTTYLKDQVDALAAGTGIAPGVLTPDQMAPGGVIRSFVRQTVLRGPVDANGEANSVTIDSSRILQVEGDNSIPFRAADSVIMTFAAGFNAHGQVDYFSWVVGKPQIDIDDFVAVANTTVYVICERDIDNGTLTWSVTDIAPVNSLVEPTITATGTQTQYWFNTSDMYMYKYDAADPGAGWVAVAALVIAEAARNVSGNLTSVFCYPYRQDLDIDRAVPAGTIVAYAKSGRIPEGYLLCNGAAVKRKNYARLFNEIGTTWGAGDGSTTFNLPDFRGEFLRGFDNGRGVDTGRVFASAQADELKAHTHSYNDYSASGTGGVGAGSTFGSSQTGSTGGTETRPRNIAVNYLIKY